LENLPSISPKKRFLLRLFEILISLGKMSWFISVLEKTHPNPYQEEGLLLSVLFECFFYGQFCYFYSWSSSLT